MSSQRFSTAGVPMTIWFWIVMFICFGLAASFECYECSKEKCKTPTATKQTCVPIPAGTGQKDACYSNYVNGTLKSMDCTTADDGKKDNCHPSDTDPGRMCTCVSTLCIYGNPEAAAAGGGGAGSKGSAATKLKLWSTLLWIGLACWYTTVVLH